MDGQCQVDGCENPILAKGYCTLHYQRWHKTGDPGPAGLKNMPAGTLCTVEGCEQPNVARGYCEMHRWRIRTYGDPGPAGRIGHGRQRRPVTPCEVDGCDRTNDHGSPYCHLHRERIRRTGEPGPAQPMRVRGVVTPRKDGYRRIWVPGGRRVLEHVYVMEQQLGRRLAPGENVHHKNGIKSDNDPANLELWLVVQPTGQRVTDLMAYIAEYHAAAMLEMLEGGR